MPLSTAPDQPSQADPHQLDGAIRHAVWLYLRFALSYRDVEHLLAERGLDVSYEQVRRWVMKFGPLFACNLRRQRPRPTERWHLGDLIGRAARRTPRRLSIAPVSV
jgi:putative transposase